MKTKSITLRENTAMVKLSLYTSKTTKELTDIIIDCLMDQNCIYDIPEECGETLEAILNEEDYTLEQFAVYCFKFSNPTLLDILKGVQFWGLHNDCEDCGCEMIYDDISEYNECKNDACNCSINTNNEPDPDSYRDDCMLSNPIKLRYLSIHHLN